MRFRVCWKLGGGNSKIFGNFHPDLLIGNDPILSHFTNILFKWVGSTTRNGVLEESGEKKQQKVTVFFQAESLAVPTTSDGTLMKDLGVSKNRGTPKWMVYNGKPY